MRVVKVHDPGTKKERIETVVKFHDANKVKRATDLAASLNRDYSNDVLNFKSMPQEDNENGC